MIRAKLSPRAQSDLEEIRNYIAPENPDAAERVRLTILDAADLFAQNPGIGRPIHNASARHADIPWSVVLKYRNYLIFYRPFQDTIMVVRILHAAQSERLPGTRPRAAACSPPGPLPVA